jgi:hypothetical protein
MSTGVSDFLFAQPSFLEGWARLYDFADTLTVFNESPTPQQADYFALRQDWMCVGDDLKSALERVAEGASEFVQN